MSLFDTEKARMKTLGTPRAGSWMLLSRIYVTRSANMTSDIFAEEIAALKAQNEVDFKQITDAVDAYMQKCGRRYVSLSGVFAYMHVK